MPPDEPGRLAPSDARPAAPIHLPHPVAVIVMGVSGSGKSTLGTMLARALGCRFLEGDAFHDAVAIARMKAGRPLTDEDRWPWLDRIGRAISDSLAVDGVSVAACSALKRAYRQRLADRVGTAARFVLLDAGEDRLHDRLVNRPHHYMPASLLASQLATLERPDADEPALTIAADRPTSMLCREALDWLGAVA
jgi:gluconokinase